MTGKALCAVALAAAFATLAGCRHEDPSLEQPVARTSSGRPDAGNPVSGADKLPGQKLTSSASGVEQSTRDAVEVEQNSR